MRPKKTLIPVLMFMMILAGCTQSAAAPAAPTPAPAVSEDNAVSEDETAASENTAVVSEDKAAVSENTAAVEKKEAVSLDSLPYNLERYENEAKEPHPIYEQFGDRQIAKNATYIDISGIN